MASHPRLETEAFTISEADRKRMQRKPRQFVRFVLLDLRILKAVDRSRRA